MPILDEFWSYLEKVTPLPGSHLDAAVSNAVNHKKQLSLFADSGRLESTNNRAERDLRIIKIKTKVSGCFRSEDGIRDYLAVIHRHS